MRANTTRVYSASSTMAPIRLSDSRRGRRLLSGMISMSALLAAGATLLGGSLPAGAETDQQSPPAAPSRSHPPLTPFIQTPLPSPSPPCSADFNPGLCVSPSPSVVVVSPVAPDPSPSHPTPSYLIGTAPSPSQDVSNTLSSPPALAGGFVDQLPTPSPQQTTAPSSDLAPRQSGLPLPFLAVGALLILGAVGSVIYAVAPRQKQVFVRDRPQAESPVFFTPHGPDGPSANLLSGGQPPRAGTR